MNLMNIGEETTLVPQGTTVALMQNVSEVAAQDTSEMDEENLTEKGVMLDDCLTPLLEDLPKDITKTQREVIHRLLCNYNDLFV